MFKTNKRNCLDSTTLRLGPGGWGILNLWSLGRKPKLVYADLFLLKNECCYSEHTSSQEIINRIAINHNIYVPKAHTQLSLCTKEKKKSHLPAVFVHLPFLAALTYGAQSHPATSLECHGPSYNGKTLERVPLSASFEISCTPTIQCNRKNSMRRGK